MLPPRGDQSSDDAGDPPALLVVDDAPSGAAATTRILHEANFRGVLEHDGDAALHLVRSQLTRLVISEIYIPCSEGTCLVTVLKNERHRLPKLRVLVYTRHVADTDIEWALTAGCDVVVRKSDAPEALLREVRRLEGGASVGTLRPVAFRAPATELRP